ncbi:MAG: hypothetical protein KJ941_00440, partial [Bacteroidetes bacterium]|nr:hypothetical protein [Bacteroidota bacterium]
LTVITLFIGSSLFYYAIDETLMSHMYSFTLFAIILYAIKSFYESAQSRYFLLFAFALSFAVLVRPTNVLFGVFALFLDVDSYERLRHNIRALFQLKKLLIGGLILFLTLLPQMLYWKFAYGKYIVWSYKGEGFIHWKNPEFLITWFSPQSGFYTYTPLALLALLFTFYMWYKKEKNAVLILITLLISSYLCASWHNVYFGTCNFGKRPMVEFLPLLLFPLAYMFNAMPSFKKTSSLVLVLLLLGCISYNLILFRGFNTCYFGGIWEWKEFGRLFSNAF